MREHTRIYCQIASKWSSLDSTHKNFIKCVFSVLNRWIDMLEGDGPWATMEVDIIEC